VCDINKIENTDNQFLLKMQHEEKQTQIIIPSYDSRFLQRLMSYIDDYLNIELLWCRLHIRDCLYVYQDQDSLSSVVVAALSFLKK